MNSDSAIYPGVSSTLTTKPRNNNMTKLLTQCPVIKEMLIDRSATTLAAERIPVHSDIGTGHAEALYEAVLRERPTTVLEVGMAFGVSSLAILTALRDIGENGRLVSIDPNQTTYWKGCGLAAVERAGLKSRHELFEDFDYNVLPRLLADPDPAVCARVFKAMQGMVKLDAAALERAAAA